MNIELIPGDKERLEKVALSFGIDDISQLMQKIASGHLKLYFETSPPSIDVAKRSVHGGHKSCSFAPSASTVPEGNIIYE